MILQVWEVIFSVSNLKRAVDFYEGVLGLPKTCHSSTFAKFDCGGVEIGLQPETRSGEGEEAPCVDFLVRSVDAACQALRERGVRFLEEPHDTAEGRRIALFSDPDGNVLQLVQVGWRRSPVACLAR